VKYAQRRYPLWTGGPVLAVYLSNCIAGRTVVIGRMIPDVTDKGDAAPRSTASQI